MFRRDVSIQLFNLSTNVFIANILGSDDFGLWVTILLVPAYVEAFGRVKVDVASVYFLRKYPSNSSEYIGVVNIISLILSSAITIGLIVLSSLILTLILPDNTVDIRVYYAVIAAVPFLIFNSGITYAALGNDDIKTFNFLLWLRAFLFFALTLILLVTDNLNILTLACVFSASYIFVSLYCLLKPVHGILIFKWERNTAVRLMKYSLPFYVSGITQQLVDTLPRLIGVRYVDISVLGNFYNGNYYARLINKFSDPVMGLLYGELSSLNLDTASKFCARAFRIISFISFSASLIFFFVIDFAIQVMYTPEFQSSALYAKGFLPVVFFIAGTNVIFNFFSAQGMALLSTKIQLFSLVIMLLSLLYLLPKYNEIGMILSVIFSYLSMFLISIFFFIKVSGRGIMDLLIKLSDLRDLASISRDTINNLRSK